jgi:hypothetical protein
MKVRRCSFWERVSLGFKNVYIYLGGMFEWLLLQDVYGQKEFPTDKKGEILDFK